MNKFLKLALMTAATIATASTVAQSVPVSPRQPVNDNWANGTGELIWTNGTNELCWRNGAWTPATANEGCDGAPVAQVPVPAPAPAPVAPPPVISQKVKYQAETLFDFDKAVLKVEGKATLDDLAEKIRGVNLEVVVATGHTDRIGTEVYNDALSARRAEVIKAYLVGQGVPAERIYTEAKGKREPVVTDCKQSLRKQRTALIACLAPNRRVEIEVVGTKTVQQAVPSDAESETMQP
jgi:OmpA-OmpF porin, OOP family